jgi:hypothetical protein
VSNSDTGSDIVSVEEFILITLCIHSELEFSVTSVRKRSILAGHCKRLGFEVHDL